MVGALAALAFSAIASASASAAEGPFFKVAGTRLASGATKAIISTKATKNFVLKAGTDVVTCTAVTTSSSAGAAAILGSTGANAGKDDEVVEFSGCTVAGNGTPCSVTTPIVANTHTTLAYSASAKTGAILDLFEPASGTTFTTLSFTGTGCEVTSTKVEGSVAAETWSGGKVIEVTKEPAEAKVGEVNYPATSVKKAWTEASGTLTEHTVSLKAFGVAASLEGRASFELNGSPVWGVYTK
jgi:hypothetical protein